ncbi:hypothetical protein [Actinomadura napierensis]|uniref:DUF4254 domain-containing protein n=1 Tax=Actinomadura napierensis TaxID=267854 RepID=A0ABN2ZY09_9ACTN
MSESVSAELPADLEEMIDRHMERLREANRWSSAAAARVAGDGILAAILDPGAVAGNAARLPDGAGAPRPAGAAPEWDADVAREAIRRSNELHAELRREAEGLLARMDALLLTDLSAEHRAAVFDARHWWIGYVDDLAKLD